MIQLRQLDATYHQAFEQLLRESWDQNWDADLAQQIIRWRYYDRPAGAVTWLAIEGDRCVAMIDSMLRPYLLNQHRVMICETADWYCTPERRRYGVGLWLLRRVAEQSEAVFVLGGSVCTLQILPKLHWIVLPTAAGYVFPVKARGFAANLIRQYWWRQEVWARLVPPVLPGRTLRRIAPPSGRRARLRIVTADETLGDLPAGGGDGLVQLFEPDHWLWMCKMPALLARPIGLMFYLDDVAVAFALAQIEPAPTGLDGRIVHVQCADEQLVGWVISETTQMLADHHVEFVRCLASTPGKRAAIEQVGFIKTRDVPCHWAPGKAIETPTQVDVGYLRGDDAMPFQALRGRHLGDGNG